MCIYSAEAVKFECNFYDLSGSGDTFTILTYSSSDCSSGENAVTTFDTNGTSFSFECGNRDCYVNVIETQYESGNGNCASSGQETTTNYVYVPDYCYTSSSSSSGKQYSCRTSRFIENVYQDNACSDYIYNNPYDGTSCVSSSGTSGTSSRKYTINDCDLGDTPSPTQPSTDPDVSTSFAFSYYIKYGILIICIVTLIV